MGRRLEEEAGDDWRGRETPEGDSSHTDEDRDVQERGSMEGGRATSYTDEDRYWGRGKSKSFPQEVTSGRCAGERCVHGGSSSSVYGRETVDASSGQQQCAAGTGKGQDRLEMPEPSSQDAQVLQKRKKKSKSCKEKKRGQTDGGYRALGGGHQRLEGGSFQDLYRGQSLEEEEEGSGGEGEIREDSSSSAEATDMGTSEVEWRYEISRNKGTLMRTEGRASKELNHSLAWMKGSTEELPESTKYHEEGPPSNGSYRDVVRSPGNGSSGSAEGLEMEQNHYLSAHPPGGLGKGEGEGDAEMEEKNFNPASCQHVQFMAQNCLAPAHQMEAVCPSSLEGCGSVEDTGTWCWCLHLYLGDSEGTPHVESNAADDGQSGECGYSMSSTLRVGEHLEEPNGDSDASLGDIAEPLTKKTGKRGETPELQEWVNWWQGWAGSCRAGSSRRRGKTAQAWGCRGEAREGQKQQDVWVLREWTRRDGGKRGENGPRVSGSEVWVLREQEEGKRDSAWPLGKEDVWVPREPRKHRSAYFMADNKWTPRSADPGVSEKGEP